VAQKLTFRKFVIFKNTDYREIILDKVKHSKNWKAPLNLKVLARAARIQPPYLTKVLKKQADLSQDQAFLIAETLQLSENEKKYFFLLVDYGKCGLDERKKQIADKIEAFREKALKIEKNVRAPKEKGDTSHTLLYHLNPLCQVVHMALTIPAFNKNPQKIAERLGISSQVLSECLTTLVNAKIISIQSNKSIEVLKKSLHLPKSSPLFEARQTLMRCTVADSYRRGEINSDSSFQVTFSADPETAIEIRNLLNQTLRRIEALVQKSTEENIYQLSFDLFKWI
jgi:uncharacterized protein (TIGR02147 family)